MGYKNKYGDIISPNRGMILTFWVFHKESGKHNVVSSLEAAKNWFYQFYEDAGDIKWE